MASQIELGPSRIVESSPANAPARTVSLGWTLRRLFDGGSRFVFLLVIPLLLATGWMRYLVPTPAEAEGTWAAPLAGFGQAYPVPLWIGLFLAFSGLARYLSFVLPDAPRPSAARAGLRTAFAVRMAA